jgi:hypothetical protein
MTLTFATGAPKEDRVRAQTDTEINRRFDRELEMRLRFFSTQEKPAITQRIAELDSEWDIERVLEANAASITLLSLFLGATRSRIWFLVPVAVGAFLLQHAIQGWSPPLPLLRKLGVRTRLEIEQERYALKVLRGDFNQVEAKKSEGGNRATPLVQSLRRTD